MIFYVSFCSIQQENPMEIVKYDRSSMTRSEIEKIKACNIKLEVCLKRCDEEYSDLFVARDTRRNDCRDLCVVQLQNEDGCLIYYQSRRKRVYRSISPD